MKRTLLIGFLALTAVLRSHAQPSPIFINDGLISASPFAPQIDAITVVNNGVMDITFNPLIIVTSLVTLPPLLIIPTAGPQLMEFSDMVNFTNRNQMKSDNGFIFDTAPSGAPGFTGPRHSAGTFVNANPGLITSGSSTNIVVLGLSTIGIFSRPPTLKVLATNIVNT